MTTMTEERPAVRPARTAIRRPASGIAIDPRKLIWWRDRRAMSRQDLSDAITMLTINGHADALPFAHRKATVSCTGPRAYTVRYWDAPWARDRERAFKTEDGARNFKSRQDDELPRHPDGDTCAECGAPVTGGLTRDAIAKIENGERRPKARTVRAMCAALSTTRQKVRYEELMPGGPALALSADAQDRQARLRYNEGMRDFADALGREDLYRNPAGRIFYTRELQDMYEQYLAETGAGTTGEPAAMAS
jgi:transcriptional regulator with XRE-family HTH domain